MANKRNKMFNLAAKAATKGNEINRRDALLGAVGIRADGTIVSSRNLSNYVPNRYAHAEHRLARKLDTGSVVYVTRVNRKGEYCNSRPCVTCQIAMRFAGVKKVYYTVNTTEYGVMEF